MKTATVPSRGPLSLGLSLFTTLIGVLSLLIPVSATAESVDSELLLLVDVANGGLKKGEFDDLMEGYATALTSSEVLDSIASGKTGKIAVSLAFFGSKPDQSAGIPWMAIGNAAEAEAFATQLRALPEPDGGNFNYEDALLQGLLSFGTEAGGSVDNGFTSAVQIVEVAGASRPKGDVSGATALALAEGVNIINATLVGNKAGQLETFYTENVIGGEVGGSVASVSTSSIDGGLAGALQTQIGASVGNGAISTVPEPSSSIILISSIGGLLLCRRRRSA